MAMPYINRSIDGNIQAISLVDNPLPGWEYIEVTDIEYTQFLDNTLQAQNPFRESDIQLVRVLEDLIGLLIERDVIRFTDFHSAAQQRLNDRQMLRKQTRGYNLIDEEKFMFNPDFD
jgi:hypothetical protein